MKKTGQSSRLFALALMLAVAFMGLGYRLVDLQVVRHAELRALAQKNTRRVNIREPLRGQIRDIRGNPLAMSVPAKVVCADPTLLGNYQRDVARLLAPLLQTNVNYLTERLLPRTREFEGRIVTNSYVVLKRKVPIETWEKVQQVMTN